MRFFSIEISRKDTIRGLLLRTPWFTFVIKVAEQPTGDPLADKPYPTPLWQTSESIMQRTDPLLMSRQQRHENTVRVILERNGLPRKEIDLPLTDERMQKIGRMPWWRYVRFSNRIQENYPKLYDSSPIGAVEAGKTIRMERRDEQA